MAAMEVPLRIRDVAKGLVSPDVHAPFSRVADEMPLPEGLLGVFEYCPLALTDVGFDPQILKTYDIGFDTRLDRVTYPIRNHDGELITVSGGSPYGDYPKYKVYGKDELKDLLPDTPLPETAPETEFYLWNFDRVWASAFHGDYDGPIIIVEGYKAALWTIQAGHPMTIAAMGSYIKEPQTNLLRHLANRLVLFFDQDEAGLRGQKKAAFWLRRHGALVAEAVYPRDDAMQPDDLHPTEVQQAIEQRRV
jgi:DNA primase